MNEVSREDAMAMIDSTWKEIKELELQRRQLDNKIQELCDYVVLLERMYVV